MSGVIDWSFEEDDLSALEESISRVLDSEADRLTLHAHIDRKTDLGRILWQRAGELGWQAIGLPADVGGLGFGPRGLDALHRQLGSKAAPGPFAATLSAAQALAETGGRDVADWLPQIAEGKISLAIAAQLQPALAGQPIWLLGSIDAAAALVPLDETDWALVSMESAEPLDTWDRTRSLSKLDVARAGRIAQLPGLETAAAVTRNLALALASDSIGGARAILQQTILYMKERRQFDRPIASFQALKHRVADLMTLVVTGEEVVALAVEAAAAGSPEADIWASLAKVRATETYVAVATDCLQMHGGVGFTWEYDVHMYLKRARLSEQLLAPNTRLRDMSSERLAAVTLAGREPLELAL